MSIPISSIQTSFTHSSSSIPDSSADLENPETLDLAKRCQGLTRELKEAKEQLEEKKGEITHLNNQIFGLNSAVELQQEIAEISSADDSAMRCFKIFSAFSIGVLGAVIYNLIIDKTC